MSQIEKAMKDAHKFADKAIKKANRSNAVIEFKEWLKSPVQVTRGQFACILFVLSFLVAFIS